MSVFRLKRLSVIVAALAVLGCAYEARAEVIRLKLDDNITPASAEVISSAIEKAESGGAAAIIIALNTPGGLETSMREIASRIISSRVPVIVYVAPSGARAASAGFVILLSSDVAAMSPGTATGAAHPVRMDGSDNSSTMDQKVVNDASAYVRTLAEKRGRDPKVAELTIRESASFTEREAIEKHLIEIIAKDEADLLRQLDGRTITRFDGSQTTLHVASEEIVDVAPSIRQRLLLLLSDPRIAFVLFALGALCVYFEFQHPGAVAPGVVGALSVVLALYGFHMLPINVTGLLLIVVAIVLMVLEATVQGFGVLGIGGIVAAVIGSVILIDAPTPELRLPLPLILGVVTPVALILMVMVRLAVRSHRSKVSTGSNGMIGLSGKAESEISPEGTVFVRGELWKARSQMRIAPGEKVRVIGVEGLMLEVEVEGQETIAPRSSGEWVVNGN